jgi:hypothetical protein
VEIIDGELGWVARNRRANADKFSPGDQRQFHRELTAIANNRGYKPGWIAHKYREKFGIWPRTPSVEPAPPSAATIRWVQSRQIAYAKSLPRRSR